MGSENKSHRAVIVSGIRTPFAKEGTLLKSVGAIDLATNCVKRILADYNVRSNEVDSVVLGHVIPEIQTPNIAREVSLASNIDPRADALTLSKACATGHQAVISAIEQIEHGNLNCVIAGGVESLSNIPILIADHLREKLMQFKGESELKEKILSLNDLKLEDFKPVVPSIKEWSTGLSMGESAELMAKINGISRKDQDDYAYQSHVKAAKAWSDGKLGDEVLTVYLNSQRNGDEAKFIKCDNTVRLDSKREDYDDLPLSFDKNHGSLTAGNSSPLTDGAGVLLIASEEFAKKKGWPILGRVKCYSSASVDPSEQLLLGPAFSIPRALQKSNLDWKQLDLIDFHEAFSAQILSVKKYLEDTQFIKEHFPDLKKLGPIPEDKFNVNGGSIAFGHPFAATGIRQVLQTFKELKRREGQFGLVSTCAAGGLSASLILENIEL